MPAEFDCIALPLGRSISSTRFPVHIISKLGFTEGTYTPADLDAVLGAHPLLTSPAPSAFIQHYSSWKSAGNRIDPAQAKRVRLSYSGLPRAEKLSHLKSYIGFGRTTQAAGRQTHDERFDRLRTTDFLDIAKAHDQLARIARGFQVYVTQALGISATSLPDSAAFSSDALRWVNGVVQAALVRLITDRTISLADYSSVRIYGESGTEIIRALREALDDVQRRLTPGARKRSAVHAISTISSDGQNEVNPEDLNVATNAALRHELLAERCGFVTTWIAETDEPISGDQVFLLDLSSLTSGGAKYGISTLPTAFRRSSHVHPLAFRDVGMSTTGNCGLSLLNDDDGAARYRATSTNAETGFIQNVLLQARNTLADDKKYGGADHFGDFNAPLDDRAPQVLAQQRFGLSEPETSGVTISAPKDDLITPVELRPSSSGTRESEPCYYLEDLWIGYRLDISSEQQDNYASVHKESQSVRLTRSDSAIAGAVEDFFDREQQDDADKTTTEIGKFSGFSTGQAKDYLLFLGISRPPQDPNPWFTKTVTGYGSVVPLIFGNTYRYRLRNVFVGSVSLAADAVPVQAGDRYSQTFPFFRARALKPGELLDSASSNESTPNEGGRNIYLSADRPRAKITLVPSPIDVDSSRFHGLLFRSLREPARYQRRHHVKDLPKHFLKTRRIDYFCDPDVYGVVIRAVLLNGDATAEGSYDYSDGTYCVIKRHLELPPLVQTYSDSKDWERFEPIELEFHTTELSRPTIRRGGFLRGCHQIEITVPEAGELEVSIVPLTTIDQLRRTATNASSSTQLRDFATAAAPPIFPAIAERTIRVFHAVRRPLAELSLIGETVTQMRSPALVAARLPDSEKASIYGRIELDAASTGEVRLAATWTDIDDDPKHQHYVLQNGHTTGSSHSIIFRKRAALKPDAETFGVLFKAANESKAVSVNVGNMEVRLADHFRLQCSEDKIFLRQTSEVEPPRRSPDAFYELDFKDGRRKIADVVAVGTSRFRKVFAGSDSEFERRSNTIRVHVPSSKRLSAPLFSHAVPIGRVRVNREEETRGTKRVLYGIRIYVRRPWFESGFGERLALGCAARTAATPGANTALDKYVTQWGEDPIELPGLASTRRMPRASDFASPTSDSSRVRSPDEFLYPAAGDRVPVMYVDQMPLPGEQAREVSLASFALAFDVSQGLWFCDIHVGEDFIGWCGLAVYRHQPNAVLGREISENAAWVYAGVLYGEPIAWVRRPDGVHVTVGPIFDENTTFEFDAREYRNGVSQNLAEGGATGRPLRRYHVGRAAYFEGLLRRNEVDWGLVKKRFDKPIASVRLFGAGD